MLFDLRGRGRRKTVQGVYLGLAVLLGGGLVLFGVGAGSGGGGLLNAFNGGGSGGGQSVVSQQERSALKAVKLNPSDPSAWSSLLQARWTSATQGTNYSSTTGTFTSSGKRELNGVGQAWQHYLSLTKSPDPLNATLAARSYAYLGIYGQAANAWEAVTASSPSQFKGYECLAVAAYAAKQTRKGDLAEAKALTLLPKTQRPLAKTQINQAKTQPTLAQQC